MTSNEEGRTAHRLRLLIVTGALGFEKDGSVYLPAEQVERFKALPRRFETTLVVKRSSPRPDATTLLPSGLRVAWTKPYRSKWHLLAPRHFLALWREVTESDVVIVLMPLLDGVSPLLLATFSRRPRYIYVIASSIHFRFAAEGSYLVRQMTRVLLNVCALISRRTFVNGLGLANELWRPLRRKATEVIISTVSSEDFLPLERHQESRIELLCVCRLVPSKRVDVALDMTKVLLERHIDVRLTVVGDGPLRDDLVARARALSLGEHVVFTGFIDDRRHLRELYGRSHIFVLCTEMEGVSLAVQEAMAAGLAVVSTDRGALAHFLDHGVDSLVVHDLDPIAFANAVSPLTSTHDARLRIARAGQEKVSRLGNAAWVDRVADLVEQDLRPTS
jgi:glycosyltransferase involved in cell wall biosynthesis